MTQSILTLCRQLPDPATEAELRARAVEFSEAVWLATSTDAYEAIAGIGDYVGDIRWAKRATDAMMTQRRLCFLTESDGKVWMATFYGRGTEGFFLTVKASTEELARSAAVLLATEQMENAK